MKRIAVVGGGISGLAAALTLAKSSEFEVVLFEASDRLGGVLGTIRTDRYLIERGADNFATLIPDALELSREFGIADTLIQPQTGNRQAFVLSRGRLLPIPAGFSLMQPTRISSILSTKTLSWSGKLRLIGEYWVRSREVNPASGGSDDESLESFVVRRLGREAYQRLVEPIVSGIFTADPTTLSMKATMPQFLEMERKHGGLIRGHLASKRTDAAAAAKKASGARYDQFMAPRDGMDQWVADLASQLPAENVRLSAPVQRIESKGNSWQIDHSGAPETFDGVIIAAPAAQAATLLSTSLPDSAKIVGDIPYASSAVVALVVNTKDLAGRIDGFGMICPSVEGRDALAISYTSNKYGGRVPDGEILLRIFLGGALRPHVVDQSDDELIATAKKEIRDLLGWQSDNTNWEQVIRWRNAMPQYLVGHVDRMAELQATLAQAPTLKICGAAYTGVGIPQCVRSGRRAAQELVEHFGLHAN